MSSVTYKEGVTALSESLKDKVPPEFLDDANFDEQSGLAAAAPLPISSPNAKERAKDQFRRGRSRRMDQPRDNRGQFREVLARLKVDLGESELNEVVAKVEDAEDAEKRGDYGKSAGAATDVIQMVDRIQAGALSDDKLTNLKSTAAELGKAIAYLPLPQGDANAKLRFSDLPPTTQALLDDLKKRIIEKLDPEKAALLLDAVNAFTSGQVQLSSDQLQSELATLLRYLLD